MTKLVLSVEDLSSETLRLIQKDLMKFMHLRAYQLLHRKLESAMLHPRFKGDPDDA